MTAYTLNDRLPAEAGRPIPSAVHWATRRAARWTASPCLTTTPVPTLAQRFLQLAVDGQLHADHLHDQHQFLTVCGGSTARRSRKLRLQRDVWRRDERVVSVVNWTEGSNVVSIPFATAFTVSVTATWWLTSAKPINTITTSSLAAGRRNDGRRRIQGMRFQCDGERSGEPGYTS